MELIAWRLICQSISLCLYFCFNDFSVFLGPCVRLSLSFSVCLFVCPEIRKGGRKKERKKETKEGRKEGRNKQRKKGRNRE